MENVFRAGPVQRNPHPSEGQGQHPAVGVQVAAHDADVPVSGTGLHQVQHLPGRQVALLGNAVDPEHLQIFLSLRQHRQTALKQRLGDRQKGPLPGL